MWMIMDRKRAGTWKKERKERPEVWMTPYELHNDMDNSGLERNSS
jgi:hypothetical protein